MNENIDPTSPPTSPAVSTTPGAGAVDPIRELLVDHYGDPGDEEAQEQAATAAAAVLALVNRLPATFPGAAAPAEDGELAVDDWRRYSISQMRGALGWVLEDHRSAGAEGGTWDAARDIIGHDLADELATALASRVDTPAEGGELAATPTPAPAGDVVVDGEDAVCQSCRATVGTSLAWVLDEHTWSIEDGPGSECEPQPCAASEVAVRLVEHRELQSLARSTTLGETR